MTFEMFDFLETAIKTSGFDAEMNYDYSGRGMFGETTTALITSLSPLQVLNCVLEYISNNVKDFCDDNVELLEWTGKTIVEVKSLRSDSLGFQTIIY